MAITATQRTEIVKIIVGLFDAAPGAVYLDQFASFAGNPAGLIATLVDTPAFKTIYPTFLTSEEFATKFVNNLVGSAAADADKAWAIDWIAGKLEAGQSRAAVATEVLAALDAVPADNAAWGAAAQQFDKQSIVAEYYSVNLGGAATDVATLQSVVAGVTAETDVSTAAAIEAVINATPGGVTGQTFTLTTGLDTLTGTSGNDTFIGDAATITSSDQVNGGAGTDTIKIYDLAAATDVPTLSGVEIIEMINANAPANLDLTGVADLTTLVLDNTTNGDDYLIGSAVNVTVKNMLAAEAVTLTSRATDTSADLTVENLDVADAGTVTVNFDGASITTVNLTSSGSNKNNLTFTTTGTETTVNVSGSAEMVLVNGAASITTFNASSTTGGVTFDMSAATGANQTITGGSGNDTLTADLQRNITLDAGTGDDVVVLTNATAANLSSTTGAADSIKGGDGTDTLALSAVDATSIAGDAAADRAVITGFEQLRITDDLNAASFSVAPFGVNYLQVGADITTAAATVSGFTSGATVEFRDADTVVGATQVALNVGMTGATNAGTPDDLLNIKLNDDLVDQAAAADSVQVAVGISGINKLVVTTADRDNTDATTARNDGYTLALSNDNSMTQMTVSGDRELSFSSTASTAALATFDATGLSGDLILDLSVNGLTQGVVVTGGSGTNTITGTGFADTITGGARADTITLGAGADTVTGGAGADTFVVAAADYTAATAAALASAADSITDFAAASDIIDWDAALTFTTAAASAVAGAAAINAEGFATFADADDTLAERITAVAARADGDGDFAIFTFGSDTYVFINSNADSAVSAGDALIKLVGVTGLTDVTISGGGDITIA